MPTLRGVAGADRQQRQTLLDPLEQLGGREDVDPRGGQLDRQRQSVEPRADRRDGRAIAVERYARPLGEQRNPAVSREGRHWVFVLGRDPQRLAAGRKEVDPADSGSEVGNQQCHR